MPVFSFSQVEYRGVPSTTGSQMNSGYDEQSPVLTQGGGILYFTRSRHPENIGGKRDPGDIWFSVRDVSGNWSAAENAGLEWNNSGYNSVIGFFNNGNAVYLSGQYDPEGKPSVKQGISVSLRSGNRWTSPKPVEIKFFRQDTEHFNASLSPDGQVILFSLVSYETRGTEDLYVSIRNPDGTFTDLQNLGSVVNTSRQEMTPYLLADNRTLFFAGNGHGGSGSFDLFMSKRIGDAWRNWTAPQNLGNIINSNGRELSYFLDTENQKAYFCSTLNSDGYGDIKFITAVPSDSFPKIPETSVILPDTALQELPDVAKVSISGRILSSRDQSPISGNISFQLLTDSVFLEVKSDPDNGAYFAEIPAADRVRIRLSAMGYMVIEELISLDDQQNFLIQRDYYLDPLEEGRIFRLDNVLFQRSTSVLLDSSYDQLDLVYEMLLENPSISIELSGHTDNQGEARKNLDLSNERVKVVRHYLVSKGIAPARISGKGYGGLKPVASNASESTRRLNRRVEFKVIGDKNAQSGER